MSENSEARPESVIAIIPARGGSKGIPRKNIQMIAGKPLIAWSIQAAQEARSVQRVVVSTDDDEIAGVSRMWGAEVIMRPAAISGDWASSEDALMHVIDTLEKSESYFPQYVVFLQATSPFRARDDIDRALATLRENNYDSVFSGCREHFYGRWQQTPDGAFLAMNYEPQTRKMRQHVAVEFRENGSIYVFKSAVLKQCCCRFGDRVGVFEMPLNRSFQIDEYSDLELIEKLMMPDSGSSAYSPDFSGIKLVVFDFDGVFTDNKVLVSEDGMESVVCNRADGLGLARLAAETSVGVCVLSTEKNPVVRVRCGKLKIDCYNGISDKLQKLNEIVREKDMKAEEVAFVGNDNNDLMCMRWVGLAVAVADAYPEVLAAADFVTQCRGGCGAVREVCDLICRGNGHVS